ncbi:transcriptional regulator, TetR family [Corynebacterium epidermidicanis]|uniref:Transcriptional regulator, TetR family n=2 Tax=Corynebacterium epidermidicanis TaxID=1050174 RepID=A0A0G3GNK3_9CORY|nr:transcriptional regulator, TetR family [Corynebacterium epidermidicanis]
MYWLVTCSVVNVVIMGRQRMTGEQRREQLISIGRTLFAERGFDGASVEEVAARAEVSKPVVYEHFGGKEGLYSAVVDRDMQALEQTMTQSLAQGTARQRIESAVLALLTFIEENSDGFQILVRDMSQPADPQSGLSPRTYSTLLNDIVGQVSHILAESFRQKGYDPQQAVLYGQALVGMISMTSQWWLDKREPSKEVVATHIVNLCWNGLARLEKNPQLSQGEH